MQSFSKTVQVTHNNQHIGIALLLDLYSVCDHYRSNVYNVILSMVSKCAIDLNITELATSNVLFR